MRDRIRTLTVFSAPSLVAGLSYGAIFGGDIFLVRVLARDDSAAYGAARALAVPLIIAPTAIGTVVQPGTAGTPLAAMGNVAADIRPGSRSRLSEPSSTGRWRVRLSLLLRARVLGSSGVPSVCCRSAGPAWSAYLAAVLVSWCGPPASASDQSRVWGGRRSGGRFRPCPGLGGAGAAIQSGWE